MLYVALFGATDVEELTDLLAVFVHHRFDHSTKSERDLVSPSGLAPELLFDGEVVGGFWVALDEAGRTVLTFLRVFRHRFFAWKVESESVENCRGTCGVDSLR